MSFYSTLTSMYTSRRVKDSSEFVTDYDSLRDLLFDAFKTAGARVSVSGEDADILIATYIFKGKSCKGMPYKIEFHFVPKADRVFLYSTLFFMGIPTMWVKGYLRDSALSDFLEACEDFGEAGLSEVTQSADAYGLVELYQRLTAYFRDTPHLPSARRLPQSIEAVQEDPDAAYYLYNDAQVSVVPPVNNSGAVEVKGSTIEEGESLVPVWALWK